MRQIGVCPVDIKKHHVSGQYARCVSNKVMLVTMCQIEVCQVCIKKGHVSRYARCACMPSVCQIGLC